MNAGDSASLKVIIVSAIATLLIACSKEPPSCGDVETTSLVKSILGDAAAKSPLVSGSNPTTTTILANTKKLLEIATFSNVRRTSFDEKISKLGCVADVTIKLPAGTEKLLRDNKLLISQLSMALASAGKPFTLDFSGNTALKGDELSFSLPYTSQLSENGKSIYVEVESAEELLVPILLSELLKVDTKSKAPADNAVGAESGVTKTTEYEGVADGKVSLKLTDKPDGKVHVALSTSIDGSCSGGVEAIGVRAGQRIEAESKASNPADICKIAIEFSNEGSVASVSELTPGCNELHGASCSFSGKLNRKGH